jgi:hypothetical protein
MQYGLRWIGSRLSRLSRQAVMPALVLATSACYRPADDPQSRGSWTYDVVAPEDGSRTLTIQATFEGARTDRLAIGRDLHPYIRDVRVTSGGERFRTVERRGAEWMERSCNWRCTVRYQVNLDEVAASCGDEVDCARRVGSATLSPSLAWLIHPVPRRDVPVKIHVNAPPGRFASGMNAADESERVFSFRSFDLDEGSFTAFGPMRRSRIELPGKSGESSRLDLVLVGDTSYAMSDAAIRSWVEEAAQTTISLFGRFPVSRATLFVVPAKGEDEVTFGKVLSLAGASVVVVLGDKMPESARHKDWVLVHELFHLGFPTFRGEGRWLGEGLATYYEPVLRARAGWTSEGEIFRQFARNMPRGQPAQPNGAGLSAREDLDTIYWGGALFCLAADVRIREETRGRKSLDDALRAALDRGGDATRVWTVREVLRVGDAATGTNVLSDMYAHYAARGEHIDLEGILASLGVSTDGRDPDDTRPLAWVRRGIVEVPPQALAQRIIRAGAASRTRPGAP